LEVLGGTVTKENNHAPVLPTIENSRRLTGGDMSLADALAQPGENDFEFDPLPIGGITKPSDLG
jgi:hypothetical protein